MVNFVEKLWERLGKISWGVEKLWENLGRNLWEGCEKKCEKVGCEEMGCEKVGIYTEIYCGFARDFAQKICSILPLLSGEIYTVSTEPITTIIK